MTNNTPSGTKKYHESTELESHQMAKIFFFLLLQRASSNLRDSLKMFLHKTAAFFTEQCTSPSLFSRFKVTRGNSNHSL